MNSTAEIGAWLEKNRRYMRSVARMELSQNKQECLDDVVQTAYVRVMTRLPDVPFESWQPYVASAVKNAAIDENRRRTHVSLGYWKGPYTQHSRSDKGDPGVIDASYLIEKGTAARGTILDSLRKALAVDPFDQKDERIALYSMVERLPPQYREVIEVWLILEDATDQQCADHLGISLTAFKSRINRARKALRDMHEAEEHKTK